MQHAPRPFAGPVVPDDCRAYAIGDVHGRDDALVQLLARIEEDAAARDDGRDVQIVFLGDLVDRGDGSRRVISIVKRLAEAAPNHVTVLRGNHEDAMLGFLDDPLGRAHWLGYGAQQTLASYGVSMPRPGAPADELTACRDALRSAMGDHVPFMQAMPVLATLGDVVFSHAGLNPAPGQSMTDRAAMLYGHPDGQGEMPVPGRLVVHGHFEDVEPVRHKGRICVDTGAYYTGRLTAVRLDAGVGFVSTGPAG